MKKNEDGFPVQTVIEVEKKKKKAIQSFNTNEDRLAQLKNMQDIITYMDAMDLQGQLDFIKLAKDFKK